jgi:hypothetical protein
VDLELICSIASEIERRSIYCDRECDMQQNSSLGVFEAKSDPLHSTWTLMLFKL